MKLFARALVGTIMVAGSIAIGATAPTINIMAIEMGIWAFVVYHGAASIMEVTE